MKVLHVGATGKVGRHILRELVGRGHDVTVLCRHPDAAAAEFPQVRTVAGDAFDRATVAQAAAGCDAIISSVAMRDPHQVERSAIELSRVLASVAIEHGARWISIGGAGSLEVEPGAQWVDRLDFPEASRRESLGFCSALRDLRESAPAGLEWTVLSPPPVIDQERSRTGVYRIGADTMMGDLTHGYPSISAPDLGVAVVGELEHPQHVRERFTIAY
jgi:putative NADH-flavin reductase